jgi:putative hydrolase of the HAD superfamily
MLRSILFDLFGTVIAYSDIDQGNRQAAEAVYAALQQLTPTVPYERFRAYWDDELFKPLAHAENVAVTPFVSRILRMFQYLGVARDAGAALHVATQCLAGWDALLYRPADALSTLQLLRPYYRLALVSNFDHPPYVHAALDHHGLAACFDTVVISGEVGYDKPDPRIFHLALDALGCTPHEALFVGDTLEADILGAQAVGCRAVLIDRTGKYPVYGGERIQALGELLPLLEH